MPEPSPGTPSASVRPPTLGCLSAGMTENKHNLEIGYSAPEREACNPSLGVTLLWVGPPSTTYVLLGGPWGQGLQNERPGAAFCSGLATQGECYFISCQRLKSGTLAPGRGAGRVHAGFMLAGPPTWRPGGTVGPCRPRGQVTLGGVVMAPPAR